MPARATPNGLALSCLVAALFVLVGLMALPQRAHAQRLQLSDFCFAISNPATGDPPAADRYDCSGVPAGYRDASLWMRLKPVVDPVALADSVLIIGNSRFERMGIHFVGVDGSVEAHAVTAGHYSDHWRPGGKIAFSGHRLKVPLRSIVIRIDRLADIGFLRIRLTDEDDAALRFTALASTIGAGLMLLLVGAVYNVGLAIAMRSRQEAWQGAWAGCVFLWGLVWSQFILAVLPGMAGRPSAQIATFLACLAIFLATASVVSALEKSAVSAALRALTASAGALVGLLGIPLALIRTGPLASIAEVLGLVIVADLVLCTTCIAIAWRHRYGPAVSLGRAWVVPMLALGSVQLFDTREMFWGGGGADHRPLRRRVPDPVVGDFDDRQICQIADGAGYGPDGRGHRP